jgi:glycosyltransferase involved in cell wall biosynthesis
MNEQQAGSNMTSVKVLHIAPTPFFSDRGCHMRIMGLIDSLSSADVQHILCTYNLGRDIGQIKTVRTLKVPGYTNTQAGPSPFKYIANIFLFFTVLKTAARENPDIIYAHLHEGILIAWAVDLCLFWRKTPLVFDMQGSLSGELAAHGYFDRFSFLKGLFNNIEKLIVKMPDRIVCSSERSAEILQKRFAVSKNKITVANDGADLFSIDPQQVEALAVELMLPQDRPIIIYTGALLVAKGLDELCQIILESNELKLDCHFLIVGYPVEQITRYVTQHTLRDICTITGQVAYEDLGNYLSLADIAIEPKLVDAGEASGKLLNYMGSGLPVVCFDTSNNRQILGSNGIFASSQKPGSFSNCIRDLLDDPEKILAQGRLNKQRANNHFSWQVSADSILLLFDDLLKKR